MYNEVEEEIKDALLRGLLQCDLQSNKIFEYGFIFLVDCHDKETAKGKAQSQLTDLFISEETTYPSVTVHHENGYAYYFLIPQGCLRECPNRIETLALSVRVTQKAAVH